jgi:S-layer homology domain
LRKQLAPDNSYIFYYSYILGGKFSMAKSYQKFLAASTAAALVASAVAPAASADGHHPFKDVSANYDEAVSFLYEFDIIKGKTATTFGTYDSLTRGDAAVILANALGLDTENAPDAGFKDVNSRLKGSVNALAELGIVSGIDKDTFAPNLPLSRGAMAKILVLGFELQDYSEETPFTDAVGVFGPYIEALYGTGITSGKTETSYGTHLNITRGEFANLLYRTIMFLVEDDMYLPYAESVEVIDETSFKIILEEAAPEEYTAQDLADMFYFDVQLKDGTSVGITPTAQILSADRKTLTIEHKTYSLEGKEGKIIVDDEKEAAFDFAGPVAGAGTITLEGVTEPVAFDFAGGTTASVKLPATSGTANLNAMQMTVTDSFTADQTVTVILKDTDVEAAKSGIGQTWGTLSYANGKWNLVDHPNYDVIPAGHYELEANFTDAADNTTKLNLKITVE